MNDTEALLSQLRDIQAPDVSMMPAPGWWIVIAIVLAMCVLIWRMYQRYQALSWQREAKQALEHLREQASHSTVRESLASLSILARRVALAARPRAQVASLQGRAWLQELDTICGKPLFMSGYGKLLDQGPYQPETQLDRKDLDALFDVVEELIQSAASAKSEAS